MVVGLILEVHKPLLLHAVHGHRHNDAAGIDLIRLLLILKLSFPLQLAHGHESQIHQTDKFVVSALEDLLMVRRILAVGVLDRLSVISLSEGDVFQLCGEGSVAAVIGPVGIQHPDLRHGGVSVLLPLEIVLDMLEVLEGHGKPERVVELPQLLLLQILKAVKYDDIGRLVKLCHQRLRLLHACLS